jgi:hypothetical protein
MTWADHLLIYLLLFANLVNQWRLRKLERKIKVALLRHDAALQMAATQLPDVKHKMLKILKATE